MREGMQGGIKGEKQPALTAYFTVCHRVETTQQSGIGGLETKQVTDR